MKIPDQTKRFYCRICKRENYHWPVTYGKVDKNQINSGGTEYSYQIYELMECKECKTLTLCINNMIHPGPMIGDSYLESTDYYPPLPARDRPNWLENLELEISKLIEEVYQSIDYSLLCVASTGIRTVIDRIITDKIGDCGSFEIKANKLLNDGLIDSDEKELLLALIDSGSASAHRGFVPEKSEIHNMVDIMENIIFKICIIPINKDTLKKKAESLRKKTPKRK